MYVPFNMTGHTPLIAHHMRKYNLHRDAGRDVIVQRIEVASSPRGLHGRARTFREAAESALARGKVARRDLAVAKARARRELETAAAQHKEDVALIDAAHDEVFQVRSKEDRQLRIRKYVDELVVDLLPELTMAWVEEVEGTDATFGGHRDRAIVKTATFEPGGVGVGGVGGVGVGGGVGISHLSAANVLHSVANPPQQ